MENKTKTAAFTDLILEVFRLNGVLLDIGERMTLPLGLTSARWQVLGAISVESQRLTVSDIGRRMGLTRQAVQRVVDDLERLGFVQLSNNPHHKTAKLVGLSDKGTDALRALESIQLEWAHMIVDDVNDAELARTLDLIKLIRDRCEHSKAHYEPKKQTP